MSQVTHASIAPKENRPVRVLAADDHAIVRLGLKMLTKKIDDSIYFDEAINGDMLIQKLKTSPYDLLILDLNMSYTDPISLTTYLTREFSLLKIIIFTVSEDICLAKRLFKLGAHGYVIKKAESPKIEDAIGLVLDGHIYIGDLLSAIVSRDSVGGQCDNPFERLSDRELSIVFQILKGSSVSEIAATLHIDKGTIGAHKSRVMKKLALSKPAELAELARRHRLL